MTTLCAPWREQPPFRMDLDSCESRFRRLLQHVPSELKSADPDDIPQLRLHRSYSPTDPHDPDVAHIWQFLRKWILRLQNGQSLSVDRDSMELLRHSTKPCYQYLAVILNCGVSEWSRMSTDEQEWCIQYIENSLVMDNNIPMSQGEILCGRPESTLSLALMALRGFSV